MMKYGDRVVIRYKEGCEGGKVVRWGCEKAPLLGIVETIHVQPDSSTIWVTASRRDKANTFRIITETGVVEVIPASNSIRFITEEVT